MKGKNTLVDEQQIWNPDDFEEGGTFGKPEDLIEEGVEYQILDAYTGENNFGEPAAIFQLEDTETKQTVAFVIKLSTRKGSKFHAWLKSFKAGGLEVTGIPDFTGTKFIATKTKETGMFKDRKTGEQKEQTVITVIAASVTALPSGATGNGKVDDATIDYLLSIIDGLTFGSIMSKIATDEKLVSVREAVNDKSLLNKLIDLEVLKQDGRVYRRVA